MTLRWFDRQSQWRILRRRHNQKPSRLVWFAAGAAFVLVIALAFEVNAHDTQPRPRVVKLSPLMALHDCEQSTPGRCDAEEMAWHISIFHSGEAGIGCARSEAAK